MIVVVIEVECGRGGRRGGEGGGGVVVEEDVVFGGRSVGVEGVGRRETKEGPKAESEATELFQWEATDEIQKLCTVDSVTGRDAGEVLPHVG